MYSNRIYLAVAAGLALSAFAIGQAIPGLGVLFALLTSTLWVAWSSQRAKRIH